MSIEFMKMHITIKQLPFVFFILIVIGEWWQKKVEVSRKAFRFLLLCIISFLCPNFFISINNNKYIQIAKKNIFYT